MSKDYEEFMDSQKKGKVKGMSFEIDTKTTIILVLLGVIFGMIARLQGWI
jgi:hypothetical protein